MLHTWLSGMEWPRLECQLSPLSKPPISGKWLEGVPAAWDMSPSEELMGTGSEMPLRSREGREKF